MIEFEIAYIDNIYVEFEFELHVIKIGLVK